MPLLSGVVLTLTGLASSAFPEPNAGAATRQRCPESCAGMSLIFMVGFLSPPTWVILIHFSSQSASSLLKHS